MVTGGKPTMLNRVFGAPNQDQQEWLLLTSGCLVKLIAGQTVSGPLFANSMRAAFQLNQSQLDLAIALQYSGAMLMFVSGLVFDRWGPRTNLTVGIIASTLASLVVTFAFAFPMPLRGHPWALCLLLFVYGHTFNYAEIAVTTAVIARFRSDRRGRVMATLENSFSLGPPLTALLHYFLFGNIARPPERETAVGAMAVQTLLTLVVHAVALTFVPRLTTSVAAIVVELGERTPIMQLQQQQLQQDTTVEADAEFQTRDEDLKEAADEPLQSSWERRETAGEFLRATWSGCVSPTFLLLLCGFALAMAQSLAVWLNITSVTRSLGLSSADFAFFWLPILLSVPFRGVVGPLSDRYLPEAHQRAAVMLASVAGFGIAALLLVTLPNASASALGVTLTSYSLTGLLVAVLFTLTPVLLSQVFSPRLFGRLLSACFLAGTLLSAPLTVQSGVFYDLRALRPGDPTAPPGAGNGTAAVTCGGQACYTWGNIANAACILASTACFAALTALLWWRAQRM